MLIYSPHNTPRLRYIIDYFNEKLGLNAVVTDDEQLYKAHLSEKINYSSAGIADDELFIQSVGLLQEDEIKKHKLECFEWNNTTAFFQTNDDAGFDIFSAVFYCISRYEEYLEYEPDEYGRFAHWNSLAWKNDFLMKPVVDVWLKEFGKLLQSKFPAFTLHPTPYTFIPTYDIDIAWSYKNKGFWRSIAASIKQPSTIAERLEVVRGKKQDPFDCYDWLKQLHQTHQLSPIYFFLVAEERGELDRNISPKQKALQQLIVQTKQLADVGLHPSVHSNTAKECLAKEKNTLQQIIRQPVAKSRHHYLQLHVPHSYRELIAAGITDDYTMGYGTVNGFRASTSNSFLWYDLEKEKTTALRIHPFAFMEANSFYEVKQSAEEALTELRHLFEEVKKVNGTFITIFHNHFLGTDPMFSGWKEMYEEFVAAAQ
ncbi:MAG: polysaccharide deacetylase family protein [Chitinophagaceae bacterium]|nr:polysaccharide deacetylase family protein [Chitinophagaceae bacterium]